MSNDCGCTPQASEGEYLLVKANGQDAGTCGTVPSSGTTNCAKTEPMFDSILSDFLVPSEESSVNMQVCNGAIYTVGMWIEFINPYCRMKITAINGNILSVVNACTNGDDIDNNPAPSTVINRGTRFSVVGKPPCDIDYTEKLQESFATVTELCMPALGITSETAVVHPVGRTQSDPENSGVGKCLRRIFGIVFKAGRPFLSAMGAPVNIDDLNQYRRLIRKNDTGAIHVAKNYSEQQDVVAGNRYLLSIDKTRERVTIPAYVCQMWHYELKENTSNTDPTSWPSFTNDFEFEINVGSLDRIQAIDNVRDHYYLMLRIEVGTYKAGAYEIVQARIDDKRALKVVAGNNAMAFNSVLMPMRIAKADDKFKFKLAMDGTTKYYYRVVAEAIYF